MMSKFTVVAAMIVKNEAAVIGRCLDSLRGKVGMVFVCDTGSTDNTKEVIRASGIPHIIVDRPWVNFGHNRSEAIRLASQFGMHILIMDADQTLEGTLPCLTDDAYNMTMRHGSMQYERTLLLAAHLPWQYEGVTHEYLTCGVPFQATKIDAVVVEHADSHRRTMDLKFTDDINLLEQELARDPDNSRTVFYLARSYHDLATMNLFDPQAETWMNRATALYERRTTMGGWSQEIYYSYLSFGTLPGAIKAISIDPTRWEAYYVAAKVLNAAGRHAIARFYCEQGFKHPPLRSGLFAWNNVYDNLLFAEYEIAKGIAHAAPIHA